MNDYCLLEEDLFRLWEIFISLDESKRNRLTLGQLFDQIDERDYSIIAPFLERLYELIDIKLPTEENPNELMDDPLIGIKDRSERDERIRKRMSKTVLVKGEKRHTSKYHYGCSFPEFIPVLVGFCLFTKEELHNFVFNMLDQDGDGYVSKRDILKLFSTQQMPEGYEIFQAHNLRAVELIDMDRGDKISAIEFV
jgi:Ca2+-binding EF-hand superfamily protein